MWCPRCHTEVAAEIAQNGQFLNCTSCGTEIQRIYAPSLHPDTRSARELLERWSKGDGLDIASEIPASVSASISNTPAQSEDAATNAPVPSELAAKSTLDAAESRALESNRLATPVSQETEPKSVDSSSDGSNGGRRDRPDRTRPERQTPKPRTTWRVDSAHTVTQPVAPPPPPVPPRRPHFATASSDSDAGSLAQKEPEITPAASAPAKAAANQPLEPAKSAPPEPVRKTPPERVTTAQAKVSPLLKEVNMSDDNLPEQDEAEDIPPRVSRPAVSAKAKQRRLDPAHESLIGPHFDLQAFLSQDARKPGRSESIWGQVLAYLGVGLITVGTTLVLWAYFSQAQQYAPTGWLVCTVGQMLLFLGVTTLISGGMQQTSHEVTRRVEYIGDRMLRFEQSAEQILRGPHFNEIRDRAKAKVKAGQSDEELESDT